RFLLPAGPPRVPRKRLPLFRRPLAFFLRISARSCSFVVRLATLGLLSTLFCFLFLCFFLFDELLFFFFVIFSFCFYFFFFFFIFFFYFFCVVCYLFFFYCYFFSFFFLLF